MNRSRWKWKEGTVDTEDDHIRIRYEDKPDPVALIAAGEGSTFIVQFVDAYSSP